MKEFIKLKPVKITLIVFSYLVVLGLGTAMATTEPTVKTIEKPVTVEKVVEKPVEKIVEKTPQACIDAIEIDNNIFTYLGENLASFNFEGIANYIEQQTAPRTAKALECYSKK